MENGLNVKPRATPLEHFFTKPTTATENYLSISCRNCAATWSSNDSKRKRIGNDGHGFKSTYPPFFRQCDRYTLRPFSSTALSRSVFTGNGFSGIRVCRNSL